MALGLTALLFACGPAAPETPTEPDNGAVTEPDSTTMPLALPSEERDGQVIFDFAELPESTAPRGGWTVGNLALQHGPVESAVGTYLENYGLVFPRVQFPQLYVQFAYTPVEEFSVDAQALEDMDIFDIDQDLAMDILLLRTTSPETDLPRGIRVGDGKAEVLAAYPADSGSPVEAESLDGVYYTYEFRGEDGKFDGGNGYISYIFAGEVLESAEIVWRHYDL